MPLLILKKRLVTKYKNNGLYNIELKLCRTLQLTDILIGMNPETSYYFYTHHCGGLHHVYDSLNISFAKVYPSEYIYVCIP